MKKSILLIIPAVLCVSLLASCGCKHEQWQEADCETPRTCVACGETDGEPLGHKWTDTSCETPKICSVCQKTDGAAPGHHWMDAACETPKTCQTCGLTEGDALGHTWAEATTEAPKTCTACNKTEGERIITDSRFTTAACKPLFGTWVLSVPLTGEMMELEDFTETLSVDFYLEFSNDGQFAFYFKSADPEAFNAAMKQYMITALYQEFAAQGMSKEEADAAIMSSSGMTMEAYVDSLFSVMDLSALLEVYNIKGFYYVSGDQIYMAASWDEEMIPSTFRFQGDKLVIVDLTADMGLIDNAFTRLPDEEA